MYIKNKKQAKKRAKIILLLGSFIFPSFNLYAVNDFTKALGVTAPVFNLSAANKAQMSTEEIKIFEQTLKGIVFDGKDKQRAQEDFEINVTVDQKLFTKEYMSRLSLWLDSIVANPYGILLDMELTRRGLDIRNPPILKELKNLYLKADRYAACVQSMFQIGGFQNSFYVRSHEEPIESKQEQMKNNASYVGVDYPFTAEESNNEMRVGQIALEIAWQHQAPDPDITLMNKAEADFLNACLAIPLNNFYDEGYFDDSDDY